MLFKPLKTQTLTLNPKAEQEFDAGSGVIFNPNVGSKVFLHWLTDKGNIRSTFTMTYATRVEGKLKLINGLDSTAVIQVIQID